MQDTLDRIVPEGHHYRHLDEGLDDMPAHVKVTSCFQISNPQGPANTLSGGDSVLRGYWRAFRKVQGIPHVNACQGLRCISAKDISSLDRFDTFLSGCVLAVQSSLMGPSLDIPIQQGRLALGTWQGTALPACGT